MAVNEFGVDQSKKVVNGVTTFVNDYKNQTDEQRNAMFKSYEQDDNKTSTTQMASVVNAALGKQNPKTWEEFTAGKDLDSLSDAQWEKQYKNYYDYLGDDKFGLFTGGDSDGWGRSSTPAFEELIGGTGGVFSKYTGSGFGTGGIEMFRDTTSKEKAEQAKYDRQSSSIKSFDDWIKLEQNEGLKSADYATQRDAYQNDLSKSKYINPGRGSYIDQTNVKLKTFEDYDPGLYTAGEDYGQFSGAYRTQEEADTKFRDYYSGEIDKLGYGNLVTEGLDNAGYLAAFDQATNRKGIADQITGLGYGSMINPNMTADELSNAFGEAQERNKFKTLLDDMGTSYGDMDSSSSLSSLYDTATKLSEADQKAAGLTTELGLLNTEFDTLQGANEGLTTDLGLLQGANEGLTTDLSALTTSFDTLQGANEGLQKTTQQASAMNTINAAAADKAQRASSGIASIPGPAATSYTQAVEPTGATALNPYQMAPIDFTGGLAGADSSGSAMDNTNIFAPPPMSMTQNTFDLNQSFNPYFDALNTQYGIPPVGETT